MPEYDNTNSGALFRNDDRKSDRHPEYTGSINVAGTEYWLSAWVREAKGSGKKFFSLSVRAKDAPRAEPKPEPELNDDVPF